jgi:hypothetical protein
VQVKIFIDDLCKTKKLEGLKYTYWDERFTSKVSAYSYMNLIIFLSKMLKISPFSMVPELPTLYEKDMLIRETHKEYNLDRIE